MVLPLMASSEPQSAGARHQATYPELVCAKYVHGRGDRVEIRRRPDGQAFLYAVYVNGSPVNDLIWTAKDAYAIAYRFGMPDS
jgi:hypothetical protein